MGYIIDERVFKVGNDEELKIYIDQPKDSEERYNRKQVHGKAKLLSVEFPFGTERFTIEEIRKMCQWVLINAEDLELKHHNIKNAK
jgi:hypothetical protein